MALVPDDAPINGGVNLVLPAFQSPDYVPGVSGWSVFIDGSCEFNNGTFRGTVTASTFQGSNFTINSAGAFFYSATPALGNLIGSIAPAAGTDIYGNKYVAGVGVYDNPNSLFAELFAGQLRVGQIVAGVPDTGNAGTMVATFSGLPGAQTIITSPQTATLTGPARMALDAGVFGATIGAANAPHFDIYSDSSGTACNLHVAGATVAIDRTSGALLSPVTWQTPVLGTGWATGPTTGALKLIQYRIDAEDNLVVLGTVHATSATPAATLFTLPAGYLPAKNHRIVCVSNAGGTASVRWVEIDATGVVGIAGPAITAASTDVYIYATVPLGNIA